MREVSEHDDIFILSEQRGGEIHPISYELLGKGKEIAQKLGTNLCSVLLTPNGKEAKELIYHGADKVYLYEDSVLELPNEEVYKINLVDLIMEKKPQVFLIGATHFGRSLAPRIAAALDTGLTADCTDLRIDEEGNLEQIRPAFSGNILAHINTNSYPCMATIRYKEMERLKRDPNRRGEIIKKETKIIEDNDVEVLKKLEARELNIADADIVVSGGRGLEKSEDFELLGELAELLGGVVGSSRPLVDDGWIGKEHQVGYSGNRTKPELYIACGISGAPQHLVGMRDSDTIVAINKDPSAPIFNVADYGIIGDLYEVIPTLINKIKEIRS